MKRLTTDTPKGNFETTLNFVYGKDGWAHIRYDGEQEDVPLHEWAKKQCLKRCPEFSGETPEEIDETICDCAFDYPDCPVFLAYTFASQAVHMRSRLKQYEDTGLSPETIRLLQKAEDAPSTDPLTKVQLRELAQKKPITVWIVLLNEDGTLDWDSGEWMMYDNPSGRFYADGVEDHLCNYGTMFMGFLSEVDPRKGQEKT